jgi:hypothetical protein
MWDFDEHEERRQLREAWEAVRIVRPNRYALFTFGDSVLPYYLVCGDERRKTTVSVTKGEVRIKRPMIITPDNARGEFCNFFDDSDDDGIVEFLLARTARFSNLRFENEKGEKKIVSDSMEEAIDKLNRMLDAEEEDRVAILSAPPNLAGVAVLRYAADRVLESGPDNIQELRERGFLP